MLSQLGDIRSQQSDRCVGEARRVSSPICRTTFGILRVGVDNRTTTAISRSLLEQWMDDVALTLAISSLDPLIILPRELNMRITDEASSTMRLQRAST